MNKKRLLFAAGFTLAAFALWWLVESPASPLYLAFLELPRVRLAVGYLVFLPFLGATFAGGGETLTWVLFVLQGLVVGFFVGALFIRGRER